MSFGFRTGESINNSSLFGVAETGKFDTYTSKTMFERNIHGPSSKDKPVNITNTVLIIVLSAIIFISFVAIADVIRNVIANINYSSYLRGQGTITEDEEKLRSQAKLATYNSSIFAIVFIAIGIVGAIIIFTIYAKQN